MPLPAEEVIRLLGMEPHPEGGHFAETFRDKDSQNGRAHSTAIYFLLRQGEHSHWHRIDASEVWHFYAGDPLLLRIAEQSRPIKTMMLGVDLANGERPQAVVPAGAWQSAETLGAWTLVGCTVSPGFRFEYFELAPEGWEPKP
jgi:predicted cupin superfamily sugar epimerase